MDSTELILKELQKMNQRFDGLEQRFDVLEQKVTKLQEDVTVLREDMDELKEDHSETRSGVNKLLSWADTAGYVIHFPLDKAN